MVYQKSSCQLASLPEPHRRHPSFGVTSLSEEILQEEEPTPTLSNLYPKWRTTTME